MFSFLLIYPFFRFCSHLPLPSAPLTLSPTSGDGLRFACFSLYTKLASELMAKQNHLCSHSWAVISIHKEKKHKNIICLLAKNPAWYNRKCVLTPEFFAQILTAPVDRVWRHTHFYSIAPLLEKRFACFPSSGDGLRSAFYRFMTIIK